MFQSKLIYWNLWQVAFGPLSTVCQTLLYCMLLCAACIVPSRTKEVAHLVKALSPYAMVVGSIPSQSACQEQPMDALLSGATNQCFSLSLFPLPPLSRINVFKSPIKNKWITHSSRCWELWRLNTLSWVFLWELLSAEESHLTQDIVCLLGSCHIQGLVMGNTKAQSTCLSPEQPWKAIQPQLPAAGSMEDFVETVALHSLREAILRTQPNKLSAFNSPT